MRISKWLFCGCFMVVLFLGIGNGTMVNGAEINVDDFEYMQDYFGEIEINGYHGVSETVVVPAEINGKAVKTVGGFEGCDTVKHLIISEGVTYISQFYSDSLESVVLPEGITYLCSDVFFGCSNLKRVDLPDSLTSIGDRAFMDCKNLKDIVLPDGLESIGENAFYSCASLTGVVLPESLTSIGRCAFDECTGLTEVVWPASLASIEPYTFGCCRRLSNIDLPASLTSIGDSAFYGCDALAGIDLPKGLTSIGKSVFQSSGLEKMVWPDSLEDIGEDMFSGCRKLTDVTLPQGLKSIGIRAFYGCKFLTNIDLPEGLSSIGHGAFEGCAFMEEIVIPNSVSEIGVDAFAKNELGWPQDGYILIRANPNSYARRYADEAGIGFSCVTHNAVREAEIPATCTEDGRTAGSRCAGCGLVMSGLERIPGGHKDVTVVVPATCTDPGRAYAYCRVCGRVRNDLAMQSAQSKGHSYKWVIDVEAGEKKHVCSVCGYIGKTSRWQPKRNETFEDGGVSCKILNPGKKSGTVEFQETDARGSSVKVPDTVKIGGVTYKVTSIAKDAFKDNKNLKKVTIGKNVTKIGAGAFQGCKNLKTITVKSKNLKSVGKNAFAGIFSKARIKAPSGKLSKYKKLFKGKGQKSTVKVTK